MRLWRHRWRLNPTADLRLIGLARRAGKLEIGEEAVGKAARAGKTRLILLAGDASENASKRAEGFAFTGKAPLVVLAASKEELGTALGLMGPAMVAVTDAGLAASVAQKLAGEDAQRYGEMAEALSAQAKRFQARRAKMKR